MFESKIPTRKDDNTGGSYADRQAKNTSIKQEVTQPAAQRRVDNRARARAHVQQSRSLPIVENSNGLRCCRSYIYPEFLGRPFFLYFGMVHYTVVGASTAWGMYFWQRDSNLQRVARKPLRS